MYQLHVDASDNAPYDFAWAESKDQSGALPTNLTAPTQDPEPATLVFHQRHASNRRDKYTTPPIVGAKHVVAYPSSYPGLLESLDVGFKASS